MGVESFVIGPVMRPHEYPSIGISSYRPSTLANFNTHFATSTLLGAAYGATGYLGYETPLTTALLAGGLVSIGGVLPDVDSDNAIVLRESLSLAAAITPMMMLDNFREWGWSNELITLASVASYIAIRFGFGVMLKRYTVHRGMWHSVPAAITAGMVVFMMCSCGEPKLRVFKATAMTLGYTWHLLLDEFYSVEWTVRRGIRLKRSSGTAFKFLSKNWWSNVSVYGKLAVMTLLILATTPNPWVQVDTQRWTGRLQAVVRRVSPLPLCSSPAGSDSVPGSDSANGHSHESLSIPVLGRRTPTAPSWAPSRPMHWDPPAQRNANDSARP